MPLLVVYKYVYYVTIRISIVWRSGLFEVNCGLFICLWQVVVSCGLARVVFAVVVRGDWLDAVWLVVGGFQRFSVVCLLL